MEAEVRSVSIGFVSTYPPMVCRLATYTESLIGASSGDRATGNRLGVVDVGDNDRTVYPCHVVHRRVSDDAGSLDRLAK